MISVVICSGGLFFYWLQPTEVSLLKSSQRAFSEGDLRLAIQDAQRALRLNPTSLPALTVLAQAGYLARDANVWEPAFADLERDHASAAFDLWLHLGTVEMQRFRAAAAETAFYRAVSLNNSRPEPRRLLAQLVSIQARPQETANCLIALIRLEDFSRDDLGLLAWPNAATSDPDRITSLLEADPENRVPMLSAVAAAMNENRGAEAEQILRFILDRHPQHARTIAILGRLLAERDAPEFLSWQQSLSSHAENEPEAWIARGLWLSNHDQPKAAVRCFHAAATLDPRHQNALAELGRALFTIEQKTLSSEFLALARLHQDITEYARRVNETGAQQNTQKLIQALEQSGRLWEAWGWGREYLREFPRDSGMAQRMAVLKQQLSPDLPRVKPGILPGREFDWAALPEPDWSISSLPPADSTSQASQLSFVDEALERGITFHFENGPPQGKALVQTSGGGVAAIDYDRDGRCDLYFTQGSTTLTGSSPSIMDALFRNRADERFENVAAVAGLQEDRFSQGVTSGDINNDGFPDLYVCNIGQNRLYQNNGDGTFTDITDAAGLKSVGWSTSAAIADFDQDGNADIFTVRYAAGDDLATRVCRDRNGVVNVCRPTVFPAETDILAISTGDGHFVEQIADAGLDLPEGRGFGLVVADFDDDHRLDVFVANDQTANYLLVQDGSSSGPIHFRDDALLAGVAFDRDGYPQACMGVASGDLNGDGRVDLFITNFEDESNTLYTSQPRGGSLDTTRTAKLRDPSYKLLGFGTQFLDADNDGNLDLVVLNGHINDQSDIGKPPAMLPQLFRGLSNGEFATIQPMDRTSFFNQPRVGRGLCTLDWNEDGRPDFAGSFLDGNAVLGTNNSEQVGHSLVMEFVGVRSSRDAIGTKVRLTLADGSIRYWICTAGDGFASMNQRRLQIGVGSNTTISQVEVTWPTQEQQLFKKVQTNRSWIAIEGRSDLIHSSRGYPRQ